MLELKNAYPSAFDNIRSKYVLGHILKHKDLTSKQQHYYAQWMLEKPLDIRPTEIKRVLYYLSKCHDFYWEPSTKDQSFPKYLDKHGISLNQTGIENVLRSLPAEVFCRGSWYFDYQDWRKTFLKFEYYTTGHKFSCGKTLSNYELPLVLYITIAENYRTNKVIALVSFTSHDYEKHLLESNSTKTVNLNFVEKVGSVYIASVVSKPYSLADPLFEFYISEKSYKTIIHHLEALSSREKSEYNLVCSRDICISHVLYQSNGHGIPIPVKHFFVK